MTTVCRTVPATPAVPYQPARIEIGPNLGWNSGARSIDVLNGGCRLEFTMPQVVGVVCGLATAQRSVAPSAIEFALQFESAGDGAVCRAIEAGVALSEWVSYTPDSTVFRVDRLPGGRLVALAGSQTLARSTDLIHDPLMVVACLYAATDQVG